MIDFTDPLFVADPYPALKELRNAPGPVWHEGMQMFLAARHGDANDVFRNKSLGRIFKEKTPDFEWGIFNWLHADSILDSEPPKHTRLRSLVAKAFNRQKIEGMRPAGRGKVRIFAFKHRELYPRPCPYPPGHFYLPTSL